MANRLPPEVLAEIFSFRCDDRDLISATHVCERWRSTLLSIPLLWTQVVFGDPDRASTYLERSKGTSLHVSLGGSALDSPIGDMSWIDRTNSLCIIGDQGQMESIAGQLCLPAPVLRSLTFSIPPQNRSVVGDFIQIPPEFLGRQVPSLRNLTFLSVSPYPVTSVPLQHLTNLQWTDSEFLIGELLDLLESAPLLEVATLKFGGGSVSPEPWRFVTLSKLRKLVWDTRARFSLMRFLVTPKLDDLTIGLSYNHSTDDPSIVLSPHREHCPLLVEPTALRYVCRGVTRTWNFAHVNGSLTISESPDAYVGLPSPDRWLSPTTPISFGSVKQLVVEGFNSLPLPGNIPIEQFGSLESLKLVGEVHRLLEILQPDGNATKGVLPVPLLSHLELRAAIAADGFPFGMLTEILREREEAGCGVGTLHIVGWYGEYPSEAASELAGLVGVLMLDVED